MDGERVGEEAEEEESRTPPRIGLVVRCTRSLSMIDRYSSAACCHCGDPLSPSVWRERAER
jgi:hypothetical protein